MAPFKQFPTCRLLVATGLFVVGAAVQAQPVLEEVIVTSQLRQESVQDVSVSVNVLDGGKLQEAGITKVEDLQSYVPNLAMSETGIGTSIYIRGIGSGINQGFEQSVGMYVDGVAYGRAQLFRAPFLDLARAEVLRGPQNVLYGKNSVAGALSLHSARPGDSFEGLVSLTYEPDFGEEIVDLVLSGPISDTLGVRLAHRTRNLDGYIKNIDGGDEPEREERTTRLIMNWNPSDKANVLFKYETGSFDVKGRQIEIITDLPSQNPAFGGLNWGQVSSRLFGQPVSALDNSLNFRRSANEDFSFNNIENITFQVDYSFENFDITSTTARLKYDYYERCDCDFTSANIFLVDSSEDYSQLSQEFRITSNQEGFIEWVGGIYLSNSELDFNDSFFTTPTTSLDDILNRLLPGVFVGIYPAGAAQVLVDFGAPRELKQETDLYSAFAQFTVNFSDRTRLILGGRYSSEEKEASRRLTYSRHSTGAERPYDDAFRPNTHMGVDYLLGQVLQVARHSLSGKREQDRFVPSVIFEQDVNDNVLLYASWTKGFKSGGFDVRSNVPPNPDGDYGYQVVNPFNAALNINLPAGSFQFDDEKTETLELGLKTTLLGGAMELNAAAFYTEFEDLQISIFDGTLGFRVDNAAKATSQGIELDGRVAFTDYLNLTTALAWLDFEFEDYPNGQCTQRERIRRAIANNDSNDCDYSGLTNQYVADFSGTVALNLDVALNDALRLRSTLDVIHTTSYHPTQNLDPMVKQSGYTKLNWRIALTAADDSWEVGLLAKNLTDEKIVTYANDTPLATNLIYSVGHYAFIEPPRTFAVQATYRF